MARLSGPSPAPASGLAGLRAAAVAHPGWALLAILLAGLALRIVIAVGLLPDSGHRSDMGILTDWATRLAADGPGAFYRADAGYFIDYPPAYLFVLWLSGLLGPVWGALTGSPDATRDLIKVPFIAADLVAAGFVYLLGRALFGIGAGLLAAAVFVADPSVLFISTIWGQNDSVALVPVLAGLWLLATGRIAAASAAAVLAMLVKFQYGFLIPIVAIVGLKRLVVDPWRAGQRPDLAAVGRALAAGLAVVVVLGWPFGLTLYSASDQAHSLFHRFVAASRAFPGVTQNAFNLWMNPLTDIVIIGGTGLTEGHVVDDTVPLVAVAGLALTAQLLGTLLFATVVLLVGIALWRRPEPQIALLAALVIAVAFFTLPTRVHERYLFPAIGLVVPFIALGPRWRRLWVVLSAVLLLDVYWIYTLPLGNAGLSRDPLLNATILSAPGIYLISAVVVATLAWVVGVLLATTGLLRRPILRPAATMGPPEATGAAPGPPIGASMPVPPAPRSGPIPATRPRARLPIRAPTGRGSIALLALASLVAAVVATRFSGPGGPYLWNLDMPKIDYPLAVFFHEALADGRLPLWNDRLGLGFPLYAEGQIGAFYPPNWLLFQLPPINALDATRLLHLVLAGTGTGLIVLRLAGSRSGALVAAVTAVLGGAIVTKLEWTNLVAAYGWVPWVLLPLVRRPAPTRGGLVLAGMLWGIQALAGHPNVWLLTGLSAAILILAQGPRVPGLGRLATFGVLGGTVGAAQLLPTFLLTGLSVRSLGLSPNDLFTSAATPFDPLAFAFANAFVRVGGESWALPTNWYPDGSFALLEAHAYVGLPVLGLAAVGTAVRRARPFMLVGTVMVAIAVVAMFRPEPWVDLPILNGLRSPVRSYLFVALMLAIVAGFGVGRLGRHPAALRRVLVTGGVFVGWFAATALLATAAPDVFERLLLASSTFLDAAGAPERRLLAVEALGAAWPLTAEIVLGIAFVAIVAGVAPGGRFERLPRGVVGPAAALVAAAPLVLFSPVANVRAPLTDFSFVDQPLVRAMVATEPHRLVQLDAPGWYPAMPDQLAAAGVADVAMFSSLNLLASERLLEALRRDEAEDLRRAVGVDVVAAFGRPCPGAVVAVVESERAELCRPEGTLRPPYWLPASAVVAGAEPGFGLLPRPVDVEADARSAVAAAVPAEVVSWSPDGAALVVDAPADGHAWLDRAWWPAWRTTVDGVEVVARRLWGGQLVPVGAGRHEVRQELLPWDALAGLGAGIVALAVALASLRLAPGQDVSLSARRRP